MTWAAVIGHLTGDGRLTIDHHGHRIVDVDPKTVAHDGPVYDRPYARPAWQDELQAATSETLARPASREELIADVRAVLSHGFVYFSGCVRFLVSKRQT